MRAPRAFTTLSQPFHRPVTVALALVASLRRTMEAAQRQREDLHIGSLEIRPQEGLCLAGGRVLTLSVREFGLLVALARRSGAIVSRSDLYASVWGGQLRSGDRSVDVYVHKLRVKLETALPGFSFIHTHVGFGYRLDQEPSHPFHIPATGT